MEESQQKIIIRSKSLEKYRIIQIEQTSREKKILLQHIETGNKSVGYVYKLHHEFQHIEKKLQQEVDKYQSINQPGVTPLEDVFVTTLEEDGPKQIVMLRKFRENQQTLAQIKEIPKKQESLNILTIAKRVAYLLGLLEGQGLSHGKLSLQSIYYCHQNMLIDLPCLQTLRKQLEYLDQKGKEKSKKKKSESTKKSRERKPLTMKKDVRAYLEVLVRLSLDKIISSSQLNFTTWQARQLINEIKEERIKQLVQQVIRIEIQKGQSQGIISFKDINSFFESQLPSIEINKQTDILQLPLWAFQQQHSALKCSQKIDKCTEHKFNMQFFTLIVRAYRQQIMFLIHSKVSASLNMTAVLSDKAKPFPLSHYFETVHQFCNYFTQNKGKFQITPSGNLAFFLPTREALYLKSRLSLSRNHRKIQANKFPQNCIGYVYSGSAYAGRGFLLNNNTILTAASCLYDRKSGKRRENIIFSLPVCKINCYEFQFPQEYQTCEEKQVEKYNYGIISMGEKYIMSQLLLNVLYGYEQQAMLQRIQEENCNLELTYWINSIQYSKQSIEVSTATVSNLSELVERGSPILISVGKRLAVIGMKTSRTKAIVFQESHFWSLYCLMNEAKIENKPLYNSRLYSAALFDFNTEDIKSTYFQKQQLGFSGRPLRTMDQISRSLKHEDYLKTAFLLERAAENPLASLIQKQLNYKLVLKILETCLGKQHWKISHILLDIAHTLLQAMKYEQAEKTFALALHHEQEYGRSNPILLIEAQYLHGSSLNQLKKYEQAQKQYEKAIELSKKTNSFQMLGRCYNNQASNYAMWGKKEQACQNYQKALKIKQKYSDERDYLTSLISYNEFMIDRGLLEETGQWLQKMMKIVKKPTFNKLKEKSKAELILKQFKKRAEIRQDREALQEIINRVHKIYYGCY